MKNLYKVDLQDAYTYTVVIEAENEEEVKQKSNEILEYHRKEFSKYMSQYQGADFKLKESAKEN
jgi:cytidylate kinase